jgi:hypothetical protein
VFGGKKTFQALKGAYERAFLTWRTIYQFEGATARWKASSDPKTISERTKDWENRLSLARTHNVVDTTTLNVRTLELWHRRGWYELFYNRYDDFHYDRTWD